MPRLIQILSLTTLLALPLVTGSATAALLSSDTGLTNPTVFEIASNTNFANLSSGSISGVGVDNLNGAGPNAQSDNIFPAYFSNAQDLGISQDYYGTIGVQSGGANPTGQLEITAPSSEGIVAAGLFVSNENAGTTYSVTSVNGIAQTTDNQITVANAYEGTFIGWAQAAPITSIVIEWDNDEIVVFDDITVAVPEPGSLALAGVGGVLMLSRRGPRRVARG